MSSKCIHVVTTHIPKMVCDYTRPLVEEYATKINANLHFITERRFTGFPANYERMQVYETGKYFNWNCVIDADVLVGPLLHDFTKILDHRCIGICMCTHAPHYFDTEHNKHFIRDGRNFGIVEAVVVTSSLTHDLWEPLNGTAQENLSSIRSKDPTQLSEFCLSQNYAKYRFDALSAFSMPTQLVRLDTRTRSPEHALEEARKTVASWGGA